MVGRTLVANRWLACSACGKRRIARPLNSVVRPQMKRLLVVAHLAVLPAIADDLSGRVAEAKRAASSNEGAKFDAALGPHIGVAMRACAPPGSTDAANLGTFWLAADVTAEGVARNIAVDPRTKVSSCFADHFARARLPAPPRYDLAKDYPIAVEMRVEP